MTDKKKDPFESEHLTLLLEEIENQRETFRIMIQKGNYSRQSIMEFQGVFNDLKADIRPFKNLILGRWISRDDKAATAIKYRIAIAIVKGDLDEEFSDLNGGKKISINMAEKFAAGSKAYQKFVDQRAFYKESYFNLTETREDLNTYINECKDHLKTLDKQPKQHG